MDTVKPNGGFDRSPGMAVTRSDSYSIAKFNSGLVQVTSCARLLESYIIDSSFH